MKDTLISNRQFEIIRAAGKILSVLGVSGLTIKNLAKEMNFAESAIYRHFASKDEIIVTMLRYLAQNMDERLNNVISCKNSPKENFKAIFNEQFLFFSQNTHFVVAVFSDGLMEASPQINEGILNIMRVKQNYLLPIIKKGQDEGVFINTIPPEEVIHFVIGAFRLQMFKWRATNFEFDISERGQSLLSNILQIIQPCKT